MYGNVIVSLAVILMLELLPSAPLAAGLGAWWTLCLTAGVTAAYVLLVRVVFLWWQTRRAPILEAETFHIFHSSLMQRFIVGGGILYGLILYWLGWKGACGRFALGNSDALAGVLGISPFLFVLVGIWAACFPGSRVSGAGLASHLWTQARLYLPVLIPWFAILSILDLMGLVAPGLERKIQEDALWGVGTFGALLLLLAWTFPALVIRLWRCPPLPPGVVREYLEDFFQRHGFRYRGIFLWNLLQGSISTAGIMGVFPGSRYILITPSLLSLLDQEELEAVMAHEMGHVRHLHMVFYLGFMLGLTLLLDLCLRATPWAITGGLLLLQAAGIPVESWVGAPWLDPSTIGLTASLFFVGIAVAYLRFGFGLFSRNFERQADLHALEIQGSALPLIGSLEKIGGFHPLVRSLPSWHHYSIRERISFLVRCQHFPAQATRHHRKVRALVTGYLSALLVLMLLVIGWRSMNWDYHLGRALQGFLTDRMLEREPSNPVLWFLVGSLALEKGDVARAEQCLSKSLELAPENPEALNNLAWLYATAGDPRFRDPRRALKLALQAVSLKPQEPHILDTLAEAYFLNGHIEEAIEAEQRAISLAGQVSEHYRRQMERFQKGVVGKELKN
jgi:Zn-dependent protease with chaperone function